jgi:VIT1/CCC1 family predicted Fe2+/Mn2+ transporter
VVDVVVVDAVEDPALGRSRRGHGRHGPAVVGGDAFGFVVAGGTPLVPDGLALEPLFPLSIVFTAVAFFTVGASRSLVTARKWCVNGAEMFVVGMAAATVAFVVSTLLRGLA